MSVGNLTGKYLDTVFAEINHDINLLHVIPCVYTRNLVLNHLRDRVNMLEVITEILKPTLPLQAQIQTQLQTQPSPTVSLPVTTVPAQVSEAPMQQIATGNQTLFTVEELSRYDGKNGNPAYTAVNGLVYDVTNNAAWAAATHFGLIAGKDLTGAFASCHAGQPVLNKLKAVGKLV